VKDLIDSGLTYGELLAMLRKDLQLDATTDILDGTLLAALMPGTTLKYLKDSAGVSPLLGVTPTQKLSVQVGSATGSLTGGPSYAPGRNSIALPAAWPTHHYVFIASVVAGTQWPTWHGSWATDLAHGEIDIVGTTGPYHYEWISFGN
jgi:hypothetical protein